MTSPLMLKGKWTFGAHGRRIVLSKRANERTSHVVAKALLWALYLPDYPQLAVEVGIGDRYKPDLVQLDAWGRPEFWGESGHVGTEKLCDLLKRRPDTHFAFAKWDQRLTPLEHLIRRAERTAARSAPVDLIAFPADSAERFIDPHGRITISKEDLLVVRCAGKAAARRRAG